MTHTPLHELMATQRLAKRMDYKEVSVAVRALLPYEDGSPASPSRIMAYERGRAIPRHVIGPLCTVLDIDPVTVIFPTVIHSEYNALIRACSKANLPPMVLSDLERIMWLPEKDRQECYEMIRMFLARHDEKGSMKNV